jgi:hypothetical protein
MVTEVKECVSLVKELELLKKNSMTKISRPTPKIARRGFNGHSSYDWDNGGIIFNDNFVEDALNRDQRKKEARETCLKRYHENKKEREGRDTRQDFNKRYGSV